MNTHTDQIKVPKNRSSTHTLTQNQKNQKSTFQFVENKPETIVQNQLQKVVNDSPQVQLATQLQAMANRHSAVQLSPVQKKENTTGLPDKLKAGIENLSGYSLDDVNVHYNSDKPAQLQAHAYAQGTDIHLASGQEKHLPHEAWHVVQQKQGRVKPTLQMKGTVNVNDDPSLETEADVMGAKAMEQREEKNDRGATRQTSFTAETAIQRVVQMRSIRFSCTEFLDGAPPSKTLVETYYEDFIQKEMSRVWAADITTAMRKSAEFATMQSNYLAYGKALITAGTTQDYTPLPALLDTLQNSINLVFTAAEQTYRLEIEHEYNNEADDSWATAHKALTKLDTLSQTSNIAAIVPMRPAKSTDPKHPDIPSLPWSGIKQMIPGALHNLLRDIYTSWKVGVVMDERDQTALTSREKNPNVAGALRSWHVNEQRQLPDNSQTLVPGNAGALEAHYQQHSRHPYLNDTEVAEENVKLNQKRKPNLGPTGYAEYTGTGIKDDFHYSKIVLDYKSGVLFLTVTHYGLWNKGEEDGHVIKDKRAGSGEQSAWFGIHMDQ